MAIADRGWEPTGQPVKQEYDWLSEKGKKYPIDYLGILLNSNVTWDRHVTAEVSEVSWSLKIVIMMGQQNVTDRKNSMGPEKQTKGT